MTPAAFVEKWFGRNPYPDGIHEEAMLADLAAVRREIVEECAKVAEQMTDGFHVVRCENIAREIRRLGEE